MGNPVIRWLLSKKWARPYFKITPDSPNLGEIDILIVDSAKWKGLKPLMKEHRPNVFTFIANDGNVPFAKLPCRLDRSGNLKAGGMDWNGTQPSCLDKKRDKLTKLSKSAKSRIVWSHQFVFGEADYKIGEFYRNWAANVKYRPNLRYVIKSCDSDCLLVALGFHEADCTFIQELGSDGEGSAQTQIRTFHLGALRLKLATEMGPGDPVRRVNDFRALVLLMRNDFQSGIIPCLPNDHAGEVKALSQLIEAYRIVTKDDDGFLVDDGAWNPVVLKKLLEAISDLTKDDDASEDECREYFRYLAWVLQLFDGYCADADFIAPSHVPSPAALCRHFDVFEEAVIFDGQRQHEQLPPWVLRLVETAMPDDAPPEIRRHEHDVFAPILRYGVDGWERARTLADVVEQYHTCLASHVPDLNVIECSYPMLFSRGTWSFVPLTRKNPDFQSISRLVPPIGSVVIFRNRAVGLFRDVIGEKACIQLYFLNIPDCGPLAGTVNVKQVKKLQTEKLSAVYMGPILCDLEELQWKGHCGNEMMSVAQGDVALGTTCISLDSRAFGVVGPFVGMTGKRARYVASSKQFTGCEVSLVSPTELCVFKQFTREELREIAASMKLQ